MDIGAGLVVRELALSISKTSLLTDLKTQVAAKADAKQISTRAYGPLAKA